MNEQSPPTVVYSCNPELRRLWQEDGVFEASLDYTVRLCLRKQMKGVRNKGREGDRKGWKREKRKREKQRQRETEFGR